MFSTPGALLSRPIDQPQRYRSHTDFTPESPYGLSFSRSTAANSGDRGARHPTSRASVQPDAPPLPPVSVRSVQPLLPQRAEEYVRRVPARSGGPGVLVSSARGTPRTALPQQRQQHDTHHHRAYSSHAVRVARSAAAPLPRQNSHTSTSSVENSTGGGGNTNILLTGLRGFQAYMGMMFRAPNHAGINLHPTVYDDRLHARGSGSGNEEYFRVPPSPPSSPPPTPAQRSHSDIVVARERRRRVRAQLTGIPVSEQHAMLHRLLYRTQASGSPTTQSASAEEGISRTPLGSVGSPLSPFSVATPLSAAYLRDEEGASVSWDCWVVSLESANTLQVPFPAVSQSCAVCLRRFGDYEEVAALPCGHLYHFPCVIRWLLRQGSCPCCRANIRELAKEQVAPTTSSELEERR